MTLPHFVGITDLRNNVRKVFDRLAKDRGPVVVIRESKPEAVILPYKDYETLLNANAAGEKKSPATQPSGIASTL